VVPYTLEFAAMRRAPRRVFGILLSLDPALATLAGWLLLGQRSSPVAIAAVGVVITASVGSTLLASPESKILNSFAPNGPGRLSRLHHRRLLTRHLVRRHSCMQECDDLIQYPCELRIIVEYSRSEHPRTRAGGQANRRSQ
jgi:hypothetical protein